MLSGERPRSGIPTCFWHDSCPRSGKSRRHDKSAAGMGINCTGPFAYYFSWSDGVWNLACVFVRIRRLEGIMGMGKPEIIAIRASAIFLLWHEARRSGSAVVVNVASGYSCSGEKRGGPGKRSQ